MFRLFNFLNKYPYFVIISMVLLLYGNTIFFGFYYDDFRYLYKSLEEVKDVFFNDRHLQVFYYFLFYLSNKISLSPIFAHSINIILFILSSFLAYAISKKNLPVVIVWILIPWIAIPVSWISERNDILTFVFCFLAINYHSKKLYWRSWLSLFFGLFSKTTLAFFPLYFAYLHYKEKNKKFYLLFLMTFMLFFSIVVLFTFYQTAQGKIYFTTENMPLIVQMGNWGFHILELIFTLFFPIPYFPDLTNLVIYIVMFIITAFILAPYLKFSRKSIDYIVLIVTLILPAAACPELRNFCLATFFILLLLNKSIRWAAISKNKMIVLQVAFSIILIVYINGTINTKKRYNTKDYTYHKKYQNIEVMLQTNNYYSWREIYLFKIVYYFYPNLKKHEIKEMPLFFKKVSNIQGKSTKLKGS